MHNIMAKLKTDIFLKLGQKNKKQKKKKKRTKKAEKEKTNKKRYFEIVIELCILVKLKVRLPHRQSPKEDFHDNSLG